MTDDDASFLDSFNLSDRPITTALRDHLMETKKESGKFTNGSLVAAILTGVYQLEGRVIELENRQ